MSLYQRILVPFDGSATSVRGLDEAIALAALSGGCLRLLHVLDDLMYTSGYETQSIYARDVVPFMRNTGAKILEQGRARAVAAGVEVDTLLIEANARRLSEVVVEQAQAWAADLIVIGTHGRRGVDRLLLGSDAEQILRCAPVPVLLVRAPAAAEPATTAAGGARIGERERVATA